MIPFELLLLLGTVVVAFTVPAAVLRDARATQREGRGSRATVVGVALLFVAVVAVIAACALKGDGRERAAKVAEVVGECSVVAGACLGLIGIVLDRWRRPTTVEPPGE